MRQVTKDRLAVQAEEWRHAGLIDDGLLEMLRQRWRPRPGVGTYILKALAIFAVLSLGSSMLSLIGVVLAQASPVLAGVFLLMLAFGIGTLGIRMSTDPKVANPITGQALTTVALVAFYGGMALIVYGAGVKDPGRTVFVTLTLLAAAVAFDIAYRYALRWPLFLALLLLFHGVGSSHGYMGHGAYFADIQDERLMATVAALAAAFGIWQERVLEERRHARYVGFGHLYIIFGLLYANLSLWFLTLRQETLAWVLVFTAAGIGQLLAGARLKDARFTGFGIVFLGIDLYTRMFERFWDSLHKGAFLLIAGAIAVGFGIALERLARQQREAMPS